MWFGREIYLEQDTSPSKKLFADNLFLAIFTVFMSFAIAFSLAKGFSTFGGSTMPLVNIVDDSMRPIFSDGDLIFLNSARSVKKGSILFFRDSDRVLVGTAITINRDAVVVGKADKQNLELRNIAKKDIIGPPLMIYGHTIKIPYLGRIAAVRDRFRANKRE